MGEYVIDIGIDVKMDFCDFLEEPIVVGPFFTAMGFDANNCPPGVVRYYKLWKLSVNFDIMNQISLQRVTEIKLQKFYRFVMSKPARFFVEKILFLIFKLFFRAFTDLKVIKHQWSNYLMVLCLTIIKLSLTYFMRIRVY